MNAFVLNGINGSNPGANSTIRFVKGQGAANPTNAGELYSQALYILNASEMQGYEEEFQGMAQRAAQIVDTIDRVLPNATMEELYDVPMNGGIWEELHTATTNVTREMDWLKDAQRINPLLVPVRAALLELTKANIGGLADLFSGARQEVIKAQWEANGGKWSDLQKAIATGNGRKGDKLPPPPGPMNGTPADAEWWLDAYGIGEPLPNQYSNYNPPAGSTPPINNQQQGGGTWSTIWSVAGPLVNSLLGTAAQAAGDRITQAINPAAVRPPTQPPQRGGNMPPRRSLVATNVRRPKPKTDYSGLLKGAAVVGAVLALTKR